MRPVVGLLAAALWVGFTPPLLARDGVADEGVSVALSGEHRTRYERLDRQFRPLLDDRDQTLALRTSVVATAEWSHWRLIGEIVDSRAELNDAGSLLNTALVNTVEPLRVQASWTRRDVFTAGDESRLDFGRLTADLGKRRLLARNAYRNTANSFVGFDWRWRGPDGATARVLHLEPMAPRPPAPAAVLDNAQALDHAARNTTLRGLYYEAAPWERAGRLELYWLEIDADERIDKRAFDTVGVRWYRQPSAGQWHFEIEAAIQDGESTAVVGDMLAHGLDHDAELLHVELGYAFDAPWSPVLTAQYDSASGDEDPTDRRNGRFDTLYGARRFDFGPTGIHGPFARANLDTPGLRLTYVPAERWRGMVAYRSYRLDSARDAWTTTTLRDVTGNAGSDLGRQLEASFNWTARGERLEVELGFAYFSKGDFVERVAPGTEAPSRYLFAAVSTSF